MAFGITQTSWKPISAKPAESAPRPEASAVVASSQPSSLFTSSSISSSGSSGGSSSGSSGGSFSCVA